MSSMAAAEGAISPAGLVYLGYPLHPPGRPDKVRTTHLPDVSAPQLFVSGTRDAFVDPRAQLEEAVASCQEARLVWIEGAGHSFERSEEHTSELQSLMSSSYAVFCLKKKK